jgi:hypothetical protein
LGDFFTNASGHPGDEEILARKEGDQTGPNFRLWCDCLPWADILKIAEVHSKVFWLLFLTKYALN